MPQALFVLYLDLHLEMEIWGRLRMNFYNKRDALNLLLRTIYMYIALSVYKVYISADSTHHFFRTACTKSGALRFSQFSGCWLILSVYILMSFDFPFVRLFGVR